MARSRLRPTDSFGRISKSLEHSKKGATTPAPSVPSVAVDRLEERPPNYEALIRGPRPRPTLGSAVLTHPAEFEPQAAVWLLWPVFQNKVGMSSEAVQAEMIRAMHGHVRVKVGVQNTEEAEKVLRYLQTKGVPTEHVETPVIPHGDIWARDIGPVFLRGRGSLAIADFDFNYWGYESTADAAAAELEGVDRRVAREMGLRTVRSRLVNENGNKEFNGKGVLMLTEATELQRNPELTRDEIEAELKRVFNLKKVIWLAQGLYEDDHTFKGRLPGPDGQMTAYTCVTTGGHIDEYARFTDPRTIALVEIGDEEAARDPIAAENKRRMDANYEILRNATDQDGQKFKFIRFPSPPTIYETLRPEDGFYDYITKLDYQDGSKFPVGEPVQVVMPASYLNFLVTNGLVIAPSYYRPGRSTDFLEADNKARAALREAFPDRKIVMINAEALNLGGGGIHCISHEEPVV